MSRPIAYTHEEGGDWLSWDDCKGDVIFATLFENGSIYDSGLEKLGYSPWRGQGNCRPHIRVKMKAAA